MKQTITKIKLFLTLPLDSWRSVPHHTARRFLHSTYEKTQMLQLTVRGGLSLKKTQFFYVHGEKEQIAWSPAESGTFREYKREMRSHTQRLTSFTTRGSQPSQMRTTKKQRLTDLLSEVNLLLDGLGVGGEARESDPEVGVHLKHCRITSFRKMVRAIHRGNQKCK